MIKTIYRLADYSPRRQVSQASLCASKKVASGSPIIRHIDLFKPCVFTEFFPPYVFKKLASHSREILISGAKSGTAYRLADYSPRLGVLAAPQISQASLQASLQVSEVRL